MIRKRMATQITPNFTLEELCASDTAKAQGIDNHPGLQEVINLTYLCINILQPLRNAMGHPVTISSGYRCARLNRAVGGVSNSQHMRGQAADLYIDGDFRKGRRWFDWIRLNCKFDQLIWEHSGNTYWVHVSYNPTGNRGHVINNLVK